MKMNAIPIIDLFAGPGGLGEGFSQLKTDNKNAYKIELSIEKDYYAHKTLELRSFIHQFCYDDQDIPNEYYSFLKQEIDRDTLFKTYPEESQYAKRKSWCTELGKTPEHEVDKRIRDALKGERNWVLIGGPPCQAYSLVGRSRVGGIDREDHRVYLYKEYLRIIAYHNPAIFVMENVKGLLSAKVDGERMFSKIKQDLAKPDSIYNNSNSPKYRIYSLVKYPIAHDHNNQPVYDKDQDFLIRSEEYGIPQKRHRVILLGIREDIKVSDFETLEKKIEIKLKDVIGDLPKIRSSISRMRTETYIENNKKRYLYEKIDNSDESWINYLNSFNNYFPKEHVFDKTFSNGSGALFIPLRKPLKCNMLSNWFIDNKIEGVCNHESRSHLLSDLARYLFAAEFMKKNGYSPRLSDYPESLLPDHKNVKSGKFVDRFKVQNPEQPASTITSHISKDGHYFIHYDVAQCRSLTVREAARIQTFPDNYFFCGPRTQQYHQVGNAVPPLLAYKIAEIVFRIMKGVI